MVLQSDYTYITNSALEWKLKCVQNFSTHTVHVCKNSASEIKGLERDVYQLEEVFHHEFDFLTANRAFLFTFL